MNGLSPTEEKWNITIDIERNFWNYNIINIIINPPKECNNCKSTKIYNYKWEYCFKSTNSQMCKM